MPDLDAIPPAPREPSPRARELVFKYQGTQKALLIMGAMFTGIGALMAVPTSWGLPGDVAIALSGRAQHGHVLSAAEDRSVKINGRHPTRIRFAYSVDGERYEAESSTLDGDVVAAVRAEPSIPIEVSSFDPRLARATGTTRSSMGYGALFFLIFPGIGLAMLFFAVRSNRREIRAFVRGEPASARVVFAGWDRSVRINGRNPYKVRWEFQVQEKIYSGEISSMNMLALEDLGKQPEVAVLYDPEEPSINTVWMD